MPFILHGYPILSFPSVGFTFILMLLIFVIFNLGIDRLERLKGIPLKLIAIEQFLEEEPNWRGKLIFNMIGRYHVTDPYRLFLRLIIVSIARPIATLDSFYGIA